MLTRDGLSPRVVWLPAAVLAEHDREPGQLTELLTLALHRFLADGKLTSDWRLKTGRARSFARTRAANKLRPVLMAADPFCSRRGMKLQDVDSGDAETFARVILVEQVLCCEACLNAKR